MNETTSIDLFAGAGGLTLGLALAGVRTVLASDNWAPALDTFESNFPDMPLLGADATDLTGDVLLQKAGLEAAPSLVVGGPPCQGFTSAGARRHTDARNTLVAEFARLVTEVRPRAFVFENVEGFLSLNKGEFVFDLLRPVIAAGYWVRVQKINVANFGVPQLRKRVIVIGMLGADPGFPRPTHRAYGAPGAERALGTENLPNTPTVADALDGLPHPGAECAPSDHVVRRVSDAEMLRIAALRPGQTMRDLPPELQHPSYLRRANRRVADGMATERRGGAPAGLRRLLADEPCKAVTSAAVREFIHPEQDRPLTLRECARIQTFPDDFRFAGTLSERATLIGNAIPPSFGDVLGTWLRERFPAANEATEDEGRLVSFEPTVATGMSPALRFVTERVEREFNRLELPLWP
jgi:DNA (cytosine-5)-methyltransferase 1